MNNSKVIELENEIKNKTIVKTRRTLKAEKIMKKAHESQIDKAGLPYYLHPLTVASRCRTESTTIVGLLHDVLEDTDYSSELLAEFLTTEELEALLLLTHEKSIPYEEYVVRVSADSIAREVKISDLTHNSDLSRLKNPTEKDYKRREKYLKALNFLKKIDNNETTEKSHLKRRRKHIKALNN